MWLVGAHHHAIGKSPQNVSPWYIYIIITFCISLVFSDYCHYHLYHNHQQNNIRSTQYNSNYQGRNLPEAQYSISAKSSPIQLTNTYTLQVNDTNGGVHSFIYQDDVQMEGVY